MREAQRLADGRLRVPMPAYGPGGIVGDGMAVLAPGDRGYDLRLGELEELEAEEDRRTRRLTVTGRYGGQQYRVVWRDR